MTDRAAEQLAGAVAPPGRRRGRRVRDFVSNRSATQRVGVLGGALVLLTAPFGGLESAAEREVEELALGQRIDIGAFYVTLDKVSQVPDLAPAASPQEGNRLLAIKVTATNHSDRAEYAQQVTDALGGAGTGAVPWPDEDDVRPRLFDVDDAVRVPAGEFVNPDQTYTYVVVFEQRADTDLDELTLEVYGYRFVADDVQTLDNERWVLQEPPLAEGHVPVTVVE